MVSLVPTYSAFVTKRKRQFLLSLFARMNLSCIQWCYQANTAAGVRSWECSSTFYSLQKNGFGFIMILSLRYAS